MGTADGLPWGHPECASRDFPSLRMQASGFRLSLGEPCDRWEQLPRISPRREMIRLPDGYGGLMKRRSFLTGSMAGGVGAAGAGGGRRGGCARGAGLGGGASGGWGVGRGLSPASVAIAETW